VGRRVVRLAGRRCPVGAGVGWVLLVLLVGVTVVWLRAGELVRPRLLLLVFLAGELVRPGLRLTVGELMRRRGGRRHR
jgi:hypothetical protein